MDAFSMHSDQTAKREVSGRRRGDPVGRPNGSTSEGYYDRATHRVAPTWAARWTILLVVSVLCPVLNFAKVNAPPTLLSKAPHGGQQGSAVTVLIDGTNLEGASEVLFSEPGFSPSILSIRRLPNERRKPEEGEVIFGAIIEDGAVKNRVKLSVEIDAAVRPGIYGLRLRTPLGLTNMLPFEVGLSPEVHEEQANDSPDQAQLVTLPATVNGQISRTGDSDHFRLQARAGQELVFALTASPLNSRLMAELVLLDANGTIIAREDEPGRDPVLIHRVERDSSFIVRVSDAHMGSGSSHIYRLHVGEFAYISEVFPLGFQAGQSSTVKIRGANLDGREEVTLKEDEGRWGKAVPVSVPSSLNRLWVAVGRHPEILEQEPNDSLNAAQKVAHPSVVNGRIHAASSRSSEDTDFFRFSARRGQRLILEVEAARLGSLLDSVIEVLDGTGEPVPRAAVRCLAQTEVTLNNPDSRRTGIRVVNWDDLNIDDYVMVGGEILQVESLPRGPDDDMRVRSFLGQRIAFFDTTPEAHAIGEPVYKVKLFPAGTNFAPNGMPVFRLDYRNDDGGPLHQGDSQLQFEAPADGDYLIRLSDVRGLAGERFAYRLSIREPSPDFMLTTGALRILGQFDVLGRAREIFNIAPGGRIPVGVLVHRIDGFDGEIEVRIEGLPPGLSSTSGLIAPGEDSTVLMLEADSAADFAPFLLKVMGRARTGKEVVTRPLDLEGKLTLVAPAAPPEIQVALDRSQVEIVPGRETRVTVQIDRKGGFSARVPVDIRNLPHGVRVLDVGLNGILVTEEEKMRTFTLYAEPWAKPGRRSFYAVGRVETNSFLPHEYSSTPAELIVVSEQAGTH